MNLERVCVFCGSGFGLRPEYRENAERLGQSLAEQGLGLVYGGAKVGLMGTIADAALASGGEVIGVMLGHLMKQEVAHEGLTELHTVTTMHERKSRMAELRMRLSPCPEGWELWRSCLRRSLGIKSGFSKNPADCSMYPGTTTC